MVAQLRGAEFEEENADEEERGLEPKGPEDQRVCVTAMDDVIRWLGYGEAVDYLVDLPHEREEIFNREES